MISIELVPVVATLALIVGDAQQLYNVAKAKKCKSVSLTKWILSVVANVLMPIYYWANHHMFGFTAAMILLAVSLVISVIIVLKRRKRG
jgi:hypothetical protein